MRKTKAFTLIELLVVVAIIALLISILLPSLARARELSKRTVCSANMRGVGQACKIYAQENEEFWPTVETTTGKVTYIDAIGLNRSSVSDSSSSTMSTTRNFWMLIRNGDITVKLMKCPSSNELMDDTENLNTYYDFKGSGFVSYGYQIPYPTPDYCRPSEDMDPRMVLAADRGPWTMTESASGQEVAQEKVYVGDTMSSTGMRLSQFSREDMRALNSPNHGGVGNGEGQNCLFQDGHVEFMQTSFTGVDEDNIFTNLDIKGKAEMTLGRAPAPDSRRPGEQSLDTNRHSSTDSFLYP
ncbi:MAG: prepilin-type N-terminal cleavage/methylation domain-containing protein [Phycisphaerales bacterium]|nr:MAG: prepilin-type N-terminal cleavage/methylation domain-containing protein [Phycisphaerales bacterium]